MIVVKQSGERHFTKEFGRGTVSHRRLLPGRDNCRVKVTEFIPQRGFTPGQAIVHPVDEVVYVIEGRVRIESEGKTFDVFEGGFYFTPAGTPTTFTAVEPSRVLCVFSQAGPDGPLPDDE